MRERIYCAYVHTPNEEINDRLADYMTCCDIPWGYLTDELDIEIGYILIPSDPSQGIKNIPHIYIAFHDSDIPQGQSEKEKIIIEGDTSFIQNDDVIDFESVPVHLQNEEIKRMFLYALKITDTELNIISPWMNAGVINAAFLTLMEKALQRGSRIKIIYGLKPDSNGYNIRRSRRSDEIANMMRQRFQQYGSQFIISRSNIHYKLVLCDEKYKLEGGYNYLSFIGDYTDPDTRIEGSPFSRNIEEIRLLRKTYFEDLR